MSGPRTAWHLRAGAVVLGWAIALVAAVAAHPFLPHPRWTLVHLLTLGVLGSAVLVWSWHFAGALLRLPVTATARGQAVRLGCFTCAAVATVAGRALDVAALLIGGGCGIALILLWHSGALLRAIHRALPGRYAVTLHYLVAASLLLCCGVGLGVALGSGRLDGAAAGVPERVLVAHTVLAVLGWLVLTIVGTLLTLWPTMLGHRIPDGLDRRCRAALPALVLGVLLAAGAALAGVLLLAAAAVLVFLVALGYLAWPYRHQWRPPGPRPGAAPSAAPCAVPVLAGLGWFGGASIVEAVALATAPDWTAAGDAVAALTPAVLVGFGAQVLVGSLGFLLPVVLGGGPAAVRASRDVLARGWACRSVLLNAALLLCLLPVPAAARVLLSVLVAAALVCLPVLAVRAVVVSRRSSPGGVPASPPAVSRPSLPHTVSLGSAAAGLAAVLLAVAGGVALDPAAAGIAPRDAVALGSPDRPGGAAGARVAATGHTTRVRVRVSGMRLVPDDIAVPAGDRLVIRFENSGNDRHDLVLENGRRTPRLAPGRSADLDAGVVGARLRGWCTLPGHRSRGMTLVVRPVGDASLDHGHADAEGAATPAAITADAVTRALASDPPASFVARDARLAPAPGGRVHRVTLAAREVRREVAPGIVQTQWTFGGQVPGPTLRGSVGDVFEITLRNDASTGHSIDFHAGALSPQPSMRTLQPGESLVYRFRADQAGVWMYHCSTMPMSLHLANGMYGALVVDPPDLPRVDREYVLVQSEFYLGAQGGTADDAALLAEHPDLVVFNGYARQYDARPLTARAGERVRLWVLAAGPQRGSSFHVVGGRFDTVWTEGAYRLRPGSGGAQVLPLAPAQGGFVELVLPEAGRYPFVTHAMVDAERGAHGILDVR